MKDRLQIRIKDTAPYYHPLVRPGDLFFVSWAAIDYDTGDLLYYIWGYGAVRYVPADECEIVHDAPVPLYVKRVEAWMRGGKA